MRLGRLPALVALALLTIAPVAHGATIRMPRSAGAFTAPPAQPTLIALSVDGATFVAGWGPGRTYISARPGRLHWTAWRQEDGRAWGYLWIDDINPCVACGHEHLFKVSVHVFRARDGLFTRMTLSQNGAWRGPYQSRAHAQLRTWRAVSRGSLSSWE